MHPESPLDVIAQADLVGSTTALVKAVRDLPAKKFIVATDNGLFHKMKLAAPDKILLEAPIVGKGATCVSCAHCPWMAMNGLRNLARVLETGGNEIISTNPSGLKPPYRSSACWISQRLKKPGRSSSATEPSATMAAGSLLALLDDIATILDDVSVMTKVAAKKTTGVLGDDLALNAQQVAGVKAERELPVVWAVAKGSFRNKPFWCPPRSPSARWRRGQSRRS